MQTQPLCFKCGFGIDSGSQVGFKECCPKCDSDLHCCRNCFFYDVNAYNSCREPQAERVVDKERANYCEYFRLGNKNQSVEVTVDTKKASAKSSLDDLFKK